MSVVDSFDNPVVGRTLTARVTEGGGVLAGTVTTDDEGTAEPILPTAELTLTASPEPTETP